MVQRIVALRKLSIRSLVIGLFSGGITTIFGKGLLIVSDLRVAYFPWLIPWLGVVGLLFTFFVQTYGKTTHEGMGRVFKAGQFGVSLPKRFAVFALLTTWFTHLFGGSAGREGVAVQIGAVIGQHVASKERDQTKWVIVGMAAGFAGLFQTPLAATFFALEVLIVRKWRLDAIFPALLAALTAAYTSYFLGLEKTTFLIDVPKMTGIVFLKVLILGLLFGWVGGLFAWSLRVFKRSASRWLPNPLVRIFIGGCLISGLMVLLFHGKYSGLGTNLIQASFSNGTVASYDWLLKLVLTVLTLSVGFQGGEVTPLFAIGATFGMFVAPFFGLSPSFVAALGYVSVFASATNTRFAPVMIALEIFGHSFMLPALISSLVAFFINQKRSIYDNQRHSTKRFEEVQRVDREKA